jgi:phosphatidylserine decarboxylase
MVSTNTLFFLVYRFGDTVSSPIRVAGVILFSLLILAIIFMIIRFLVRSPLTLWGLPQLVVFPLVPACAMIILFIFFRHYFWVIPAEIVLFLITFWMFSFFRNPKRHIIEDESVLYVPADGKITDISIVEDEEHGSLLRVSIFLSIFNVHLNRVPCSVKVEKKCYKKGMFKDARDPDSSRVNESNTLYLRRLAEPEDLLLVRQISGAVARKIVCKAKESDELKQGALFGMIKFGSRTELFFPVLGRSYDLCVKSGDHVQAGLTPLARYING